MNMKTVDFDGIYIKKDGEEVTLGFSTKPQELRCKLLLDNELKKGNADFEMIQRPHFNTCGVMLDMSRGGVMKVETVCKMIDDVANLGMNMIMLYTETIYTMEKYPLFGYMQGRYSLEELQTIDHYAAEKGVEVIPCIQTLGHLANYIKWHAIPSDNASVLLAGDERCYEFIEEEIKTMRSAFRSNRIHIGMDEAAGLGLGKYLEKNGYRDAADIFNEHLKRVLEITEKYDYEAMIWSDMYYGSAVDYTNPEYIIRQEAIDGAPEKVTHVFWDYYHTTYDYYDQKLGQEARFPNKTAFAGGIWTWDGFLPNFRYTYQTMAPALACCIDRDIDIVIATMWGNDGYETDFQLARAGLAIFSEYCYRGKECTLEDIYEIAEALSGEKSELINAVSDFWLDEEGAVRIGKAVIYCDMLVDTFCQEYDWNKIVAYYEKSLAVIRRYKDAANGQYYEAVLDVALGKAMIMSKLRPAYKQKDLDTLMLIYEEIPKLRSKYLKLYDIFESNWLASNKACGLQRITIRFGGMDLRLEYVQEIMGKYLNGELDVIEELEEELVPGLSSCWKDAMWYTGLN